uniref:Putative secreted protein n=1 Tax=Anopheles darlingi TaxID=43151 RepID=A0A2M4DF49_ANODA
MRRWVVLLALVAVRVAAAAVAAAALVLALAVVRSKRSVTPIRALSARTRMSSCWTICRTKARLVRSANGRRRWPARPTASNGIQQRN